MSDAARGAKLVLGPPRHEFVGSATVQIWTCAPGVALVRVAGKADVDVARAIGGALEAVIEELGSIAVFYDFASLTGYTSEARVELIEWSKVHWSKHRSTHALVASKAVAMAVTVATIALPGLRSHTERARFEAALVAEIDHASSKR